MTGGASWTPAVFDRIYAAHADPWDFATSPYEREKYAATLAFLPPRRIGAALELGCSIGVFSAALAPSCDEVLAVDCAQAAIDRARLHCAAHPNVAFLRATLPHECPEGIYDLIVVSELLYFLSPEDIRALARRLVRAVAADGHVLLVNWRGETDTPCTGDQAADIFIAWVTEDLTPVKSRTEPLYRLDLLAARRF